MLTTVLVCDDEPDLREIYVHELSQCGFDVVEASGGWEAIELLERQPIGAIVSDLRMPRGTGLELLDAARARLPRSAPFLLLSGNGEQACQTLFARGADAVLNKPFPTEQLPQTIARLLQPLPLRWKPRTGILPTGSQLSCPTPDHRLRWGRGGFVVEMPIPPYSLRVGPTPVRFSVPVPFCNDRTLDGSGRIHWIQRSPETGGILLGVEILDLAEEQLEEAAHFFQNQTGVAFIPNE